MEERIFFCVINVCLFMISLSNKLLESELNISQSLYIVGYQGVLGKRMTTPVSSASLHKREIRVDEVGHRGSTQAILAPASPWSDPALLSSSHNNLFLPVFKHIHIFFSLRRSWLQSIQAIKHFWERTLCWTWGHLLSMWWLRDE